MKKAREYAIGIPAYDNGKYGIDSIIRQVQKDAIEEVLKLAAEKAETKMEFDYVRRGELNGYSDDSHWIRDQDGSGINFYADKNSILSLKDELFKQIE